MLNGIWLALVLIAVGVGAYAGTMEAVSKAALDQAVFAIQFVIKLAGGMVLFLGLVRAASAGGLMQLVVRGLRPLLRRLFPDVPADHPAMSAIVMNFAANVLGLGNAATPFGLRAMVELDKLNAHRGVATNAMALFLAINTSSIVLLPPTGTVMARVATGSEIPFAIWLPTLFATLCSTVVAVSACLLLQRLPMFRVRPLAEPLGVEDAASVDDLPEPEIPEAPEGRVGWARGALIAGFALLVVGGLVRSVLGAEDGAAFLRDEVASHWLLPILIAALALVAFAGRVPIYDTLVSGGKEGLLVSFRIAPYLVAILVAIGMFRASGALGLLIGAIEPVTSLIGVPGEALPMALLRPLSGSGAFAIMAEILEANGPDTFVGLLTSTFQGSTETTFYVLAVYLGAASIRDSRHILPACLLGDLAGFAGAIVACHFFFGALA
ncbi:MAG: nucleoside recognition domain-containing protein [Myxococcota bacterium]|nr:nucleoside recognition domain-containing protein [Myxococcota bacterium]